MIPKELRALYYLTQDRSSLDDSEVYVYLWDIRWNRIRSTFDMNFEDCYELMIPIVLQDLGVTSEQT